MSRFALHASSLGLAALLGAAAIGCGHTETHQALLRAPEPQTDRPVELYMADQPVPVRPFYEIALVQAIGYGDEAHPENVAKALTEKARHLGCDAVLHTYVDQGYSRAHAAGVCVKWLAPAPAGAANNTPLLPPDRSSPTPPPSRPAPAPKIEPLPSAGPDQGGGR